MPAIDLTLNPNAVARPAQEAAMTAAQVIAVALNSCTDDRLAEPWMTGPGVSYRFTGSATSVEERRNTYETWLLGKGFQDLTRGIREMLEEAYFYVSVLSWGQKEATREGLEHDLASIRRKAQKLKFPALLKEVTGCLTSALSYGSELVSLQRARNCLEHRRGIVGKQDVDQNTQVMTLLFPRIKAYYMRGDQEVKIAAGEIIDASAMPQGVTILVRCAERMRTYSIGARIDLTSTDFIEIAMACHLFAGDLVQKLPIVGQSQEQSR